MTTGYPHQRFLAALILSLLIIGCTDNRPRSWVEEPYEVEIPNIIAPVADIQFNDPQLGPVVTEVAKMTVHNGSLYLTGKPFAFSRWDVSADPEVPHVTFAVSDELKKHDDVKGNPFQLAEDQWWDFDAYATGALAIMGRHGIMSGTAGVSVVDMSSTHIPRETGRFPLWENDQLTYDTRFMYKAILPLPEYNKAIGFRQEDYIIGLSTASLPNLNYLGRMSFPGGTQCCVRGVARFNDLIGGSNGSMAYLATGTQLLFYRISGGSIQYRGRTSKLRAVNVYATSRFLYIQHRPISMDGYGALPNGIYVVDHNGQLVTMLPIDPYEFAVHDNDTHIYTNMDYNAVRIYRILWENAGVY